MQFTKAVKTGSKLRLALIGPSGSGKTYTALRLAQELGKRIAVIDTEHGSASKYADIFNFDTLQMTSYSPKSYIEAIQAASDEGYEVIVVDSLSHAWNGKDGALEQVDKIGMASKGNTYAAWGKVTPMWNDLLDAIVRVDADLIGTMRSKTEYVLETNANGKQAPRKIGMAPVFRDGGEYEFDVVGEMTLDHTLVVTKTRCRELDGAVIDKPGPELAATLGRWLAGEPLPQVAEIDALGEAIAGKEEWHSTGRTSTALKYSDAKASSIEQLTVTEANTLLATLKKRQRKEADKAKADVAPPPAEPEAAPVATEAAKSEPVAEEADVNPY